MTPELSIVIPCLNEGETVGQCVTKAVGWLADNPTVTGEVIVADNGSTDDSRDVAERAGARVVAVEARGYGSALMGGIAAAQGRFVVMGDADGSYDFGDLQPFVEKLRAGFDLVLGCRLPAGGGKLMKNAMPFLHRWWGNPMFTRLARSWFGAPLNDIYCGLRGFRKDFQLGLDQRCTGMEFAIEMVIKACLRGAKISEVPITLYPDGRTVRGPHLRTFRDGWRTLRFFLLYSPSWLFLAPGAALLLFGLIGYALALPGIALGSLHFDAHTLLFASLALICGFQAIAFFLFAKVFAISEGLLPESTRGPRLLRWINLERGLVLGVISLVAGVVLLAWAINLWRETGFGPLDYSRTMRFVIPGATLTAIGFQAVLASFFLSVLGLKRK
jgi:glycosyltransferase involved in cell wall biosynthesis